MILLYFSSVFAFPQCLENKLDFLRVAEPFNMYACAHCIFNLTNKITFVTILLMETTHFIHSCFSRFCGMIQFQGDMRKKVFFQLFLLLCHPFPTVSIGGVA